MQAKLLKSTHIYTYWTIGAKISINHVSFLHADVMGF